MAHGSQLINLVQIAEHVGDNEGVDYGALVEWICRTFECKQRAAKDALAILRTGGWIESRDGQPDGRLRSYSLTIGGREDLGTAVGRSAIRGSRKHFSTCSKRARRLQIHQEQNEIVEQSEEQWRSQQKEYRAYGTLVQPI